MPCRKKINPFPVYLDQWDLFYCDSVSIDSRAQKVLCGNSAAYFIFAPNDLAVEMFIWGKFFLDPIVVILSSLLGYV